VNRRGQGKESTQRTKLKLNNGMNRNRLIWLQVLLTLPDHHS
jgi:hypothetical protein